ncbi:10881_t:CDS:1, partial [Dentiscutata heterogama]
LIRDPTDPRHTQLIYQPEEIKQAVAQHFNTQYNKETILAISITREWESEYNPKTWIQEE